jgi:dTDP-4-amino-4,6-dideoxygalactose transaminase
MKKIKFLENKILNFSEIKKIYKISQKKNHHANFGPVSNKLEKFIHKLCKLPSNYCAIMCSSGTSAMLTAANFLRMQGINKFATSNYTFFSSKLNFLDNSKVIETDNRGLIDLKNLQKERNEFQALIYTNLFNLDPNYNEIYKFCKINKKALIVDNALNLLERPENLKNRDIFEIVSFHHTKPWGFGEGGVLICRRKHEKKLRNLMNFAAINFDELAKYGLNSKISDLSCAAILDRLKNYKKIIKIYNKQKNRLVKIIKDNFIFKDILNRQNKLNVSNYLAVVAENKIDKDDLKKLKYIECRKYYRPFKSTKFFKRSNQLFDRIVCIPTGPHLQSISDKNIIKDLKNFFSLKTTN